MTLDIISVIVFLAGSAIDSYSSYLIKEDGGLEWNIFIRDSQKKYAPIRNAIFTGIFLVASIVAMQYSIAEQAAWTLVVLGVARAVAGGFNYSKHQGLAK